MYPEDLVMPMRKELTDAGFKELLNSEDVKAIIAKNETTLIIVNSVCGCAAANARPGAIESLNNSKSPANIATVFAGVDKEATDTARGYMIPFPPSSPCIALFKDGE